MNVNVISGGAKMYDVKEVANIFKVSERTIRRWIKINKLQAKKIVGVIRIDNESVEKLKRGE